MYALLNEHKNIWLNLHRSVPLMAISQDEPRLAGSVSLRPLLVWKNASGKKSWMPFRSPNQQCESAEWNSKHWTLTREKCLLAWSFLHPPMDFWEKGYWSLSGSCPMAHILILLLPLLILLHYPEPLVNNWRSLREQSFTAHMPVQTATSAFRLGRRGC